MIQIDAQHIIDALADQLQVANVQNAVLTAQLRAYEQERAQAETPDAPTA
jgi:hypothetical protein